MEDAAPTLTAILCFQFFLLLLLCCLVHAYRSAGAAESPLLSAKSGMNTLIEGGRDQKLTARLQKLQGMAVKESASERALKTDFFAKVREFGHRLGLTHAMQVGGRWVGGL